MRWLVQVVDYDDHFNRLRQEPIRNNNMNNPTGFCFKIKSIIFRNRNNALIVDCKRNIRFNKTVLEHTEVCALYIRVCRKQLADLGSSLGILVHRERRITNNRSFVLVDNLEHDNGIG